MGIRRGPNIIQEGLVLSLDAGNVRSYPGSGATWFDVSGKGNHTTLNNGITRSTANNGTMVLDGSNDYIAAPSVNSLGGLPNHAFEIWVKTPGLGSGKTIGGLICPDYGMISYIGGDGNVTYYLYSTDAGYPGSYVASIGTSGVNIFDNKWHHIVCTRGDNLPAHIYVDGILKVSSGNTGTWSGTTIWSSMATQIGNNPNDAYYNLLGDIAIAKIYKKYLSASEILQNFNMTKTRFGL